MLRCCPSHSHGTIEQAVARLKSAGLRITAPRRALIEALAAGGPVSADRLHRRLRRAVRCDLVTVYRCLEVFARSGIVRRLHFAKGTALFELELAEAGHHHHIVCRVCKMVEPVDGCPVETLEHALRARGFRDVAHVVEFFGTCPRCTARGGGAERGRLSSTRLSGR